MKAILKILLTLLLLAGLVYLGVVGMVVWREHHIPPLENYDAIIVLGAQVKADGTPSVQLQWRLDAALEAYKKSPCTVVVCGAQGADEPMPEAELMRAYLAQRGVPFPMILEDSTSFNTRQNLRNAADMLKARGLSRPVIVTSDYHLPRAMALAQDEGLTSPTGIGSPTLGGYHWVKNHAREAVAWIKYWVENLLGVEITPGRGG